MSIIYTLYLCMKFLLVLCILTTIFAACFVERMKFSRLSKGFRHSISLMESMFFWILMTLR